MIREAHKTQTDALYIVNTNAIQDERLEVELIHHLAGYLPFSINKLWIINRSAEAASLSVEETLELYVSMYSYHDRWSKLESADFRYRVDWQKDDSAHSMCMENIIDLTDIYTLTDEKAPLTTRSFDAANRLMDYCEKENLKILFITDSRVEDEEQLKQIDELNAMLEAPANLETSSSNGAVELT